MDQRHVNKPKAGHDVTRGDCKKDRMLDHAGEGDWTKWTKQTELRV